MPPHDAILRTDFAIDVGAWADEEGHYLSLLGSRSFCGEVTEQIIDQTRNRVDGKPLREALTEIAKTYNVSHSTISRLPYNGTAEAGAAE